MFLLLQTALIGALVYLYGGSPNKAVMFFITVMSAITFLCSGIVPLKILWMLQAANILIVFAGKVSNIYFIVKNGYYCSIFFSIYCYTVLGNLNANLLYKGLIRICTFHILCDIQFILLPIFITYNSLSVTYALGA